MIDTLPELLEYLDMRGSKYGIDATELLNAIPEDARSPKVAYQFMQEKDISHIVPLSQGGDPAGNNWVLEDSAVNRSRGAETMTEKEIADTHVDGELDAKRLVTAAAVGGSLAAGSSIVEGALVAGQVAGGLAAGAAEATFITTVVLPTVVTGTIIGGICFCGWKLYKHLSK